ncbi:hypothetical protein [Desmospora activa]|uniref:Uncharacterized protein n=1 Tax=Desmospora activa DSM 45169 TaxID=1121389 RepID=A0A2T4Z1L8_9BACL|nr:hypothetical protein [Desmospora activa]PTM54641.1 hypothetical protein C8J48_3293 [Desmospora activa DSM 45169]
MPDWSYRTLFQPLLFSLSDERARRLTLGAMRGLYRFPLGKQLIQHMGHMAPSPKLSRHLLGVELASPVAIAGDIDPERLGVEPLSLFGAGLLDLGMVTEEPIVGTIIRNDKEGGLQLSHPWVNQGKEALLARLRDIGSISTPLTVRLGYKPTASVEEITHERTRLLRELAPFLSFFILDETHHRDWDQREWMEHLAAVAAVSREMHKPLIAHDRAGFGGTLLATGIVFLLTALWGIRQGERWVWWALFLSGLPGFVAGIGVHFDVGYIDHFHLLPAYIALGLYVAGLVLTYPYLMDKKQTKILLMEQSRHV